MRKISLILFLGQSTSIDAFRTNNSTQLENQNQQSASAPERRRSNVRNTSSDNFTITQNDCGNEDDDDSFDNNNN